MICVVRSILDRMIVGKKHVQLCFGLFLFLIGNKNLKTVSFKVQRTHSQVGNYSGVSQSLGLYSAALVRSLHGVVIELT